MKAAFKCLSLVLVGGFLLTGCGSPQFADFAEVTLDPDAGVAVLDMTLGDNLEIDLDGEFPIGGDDYGTLTFIRGDRTSPAKIRVTFDLAKVASDQIDLDGFDLSTKLPNGSSYPRAIVPPLIEIPVVKEGDITVTALVSAFPYLQIGVNIGIKQFSSRYVPAGIAAYQNFVNDEGVAYAGVAVYGPGNNLPGGVHISANFGDVLGFAPASSALMASSSSRTFLAASSSVDPLANVQAIHWASWENESSTYDPRRQLKGRSGRKALSNVRKILKPRR